MMWWWLALAIPVAIHWLSRGRGRRILVGDDRFFAETTPRTLRIHQLRRWVLLAVRLVLLLSIAGQLWQPVAEMRTTNQGPAWRSPAAMRQETRDSINTAPMRALTMIAEGAAGSAEVATLVDDAAEGTAVFPAAAQTLTWNLMPAGPPATLEIGLGTLPGEMEDALDATDIAAGRVVRIACRDDGCADQSIHLWMGDGEAPADSIVRLRLPRPGETFTHHPRIPIPGSTGHLIAAARGDIVWERTGTEPIATSEVNAVLDQIAPALLTKPSAPSVPTQNRSLIAVLLIVLLFGFERYLSLRRNA